MLIALFTMLSILLFGGGESPFLVPDAQKLAKKHITDTERKKEVLAVMADYKKEWKALAKTKKKQAKEVSKLISDQTTTTQQILTHFTTYREEREKINALLVESRIKAQQLITEEEWKQIMASSIEKANKKADKTEKSEYKQRLKQTEQMVDLENATEKYVPKQKQAKAQRLLDQFESSMADLMYITQNQSQEVLQVIANKESSKRELETMVNQTEDFRAHAHRSFLKLREGLTELTPEENWKYIAKELNKFVK
jgi:hypothetical protein